MTNPAQAVARAITRRIRSRIDRKPLSRRAAVVAAASSLVVVGGGAVAWGQLSAAIPGADGVIHACYNTAPRQNGALRVIDPGAGQTCNSTYETPLTFNQTGPQGPAGPVGPEGPAGTPGAPGTHGVSDFKIVEMPFKDEPLPIRDRYFSVHCPGTTKALGGGAVVRIHEPGQSSTEPGDGAVTSIPLPGSSGWAANVNQEVVGTATRADILVMATCATVAP